MAGKIIHYTEEQVKKYTPLWFFLYTRKYPYFSRDEIMALIKTYRCPPWRWPAPTWYRGKLNAMASEIERVRRETGVKITRKEAQKRVEEQEDEKVSKAAKDRQDPIRWVYRISKPERRKGIIK